MISNISFKGSVHLTGATKYLSKPDEVQEMQKYADKNDCDVVVLKRDYYTDNEGKYHTILVQEFDGTGVNLFAQKIFDFFNCKDNETPPKFEYMPDVKLSSK